MSTRKQRWENLTEVIKKRSLHKLQIDSYTFGKMRFHSKFGLLGWVLTFIALVLVYDGLSEHPVKILNTLCAVLGAALIIFHILNTFFVYWEFDGKVLIDRRFWKLRTFAPNEILRVSGVGNWGTTPSSIRIDYFRIEKPLKSGKLYLNPKNLPQFIDKLRGFAPEAAFDI